MTAPTTDALTYAYERLAHLIELRQPAASRRLPTAAALSKEIGVSRPVVLEALRQLADEGRVAVSQGAGGIWVLSGQQEGRKKRQRWARENASTIAAMAVLRRILEPGIARYVAERGMSAQHLLEAKSLLAQMRAAPTTDREQLVSLDSQFHLLLGRATRLPILIEQLDQCRAWVAPMFEFVNWPDGREDQSNDDHAALVGAIESRDGAEAEAVMVSHVALSVDLVHTTLRDLGATDFELDETA